MSPQIEVIAIITPAPGKSDQVLEEFAILNKKVEENEPGVLRYQLYKQNNAPEEVFVYIEVYENMAAADVHLKTEWLNGFKSRAVEERMLAKPLEIMILESLGGFGMRAAKA